jgi:DNA replication licensing factor MCM7
MEAPQAGGGYEGDLEQLLDFMRTFRDSSTTSFKYKDMLENVARRDSRVVTVDLDDIVEFTRDTELASKIQNNTKRYDEIVKQAIDQIMPVTVDAQRETEDVIDVLYVQRVTQLEDEREQNVDGSDQPVDRYLPDDLRRRYEVKFKPRSDEKNVPIRKVLSDQIGSLITVRGIVTRVTDVKPQVWKMTIVSNPESAVLSRPRQLHTLATNVGVKPTKR